jgi:MFS family permease
MLTRKKVFYGWWIIAVATILNGFAGAVFFLGLTMFFKPISSDFGWTAAMTSIPFMLKGSEMGIGALVVGFLVDRVGARKLMIPGWLAVAAGFLWMSTMSSLGEFIGSFSLVAIGISFAVPATISAVVANWFLKKRSRAMTIVMVGMDAGALLIPAMAWSIVQYGWRETLVIMAICALVIGVPLSLVFRHKPEQYGYLPDGQKASSTGNATQITDNRLPKDLVKPVPVTSSVNLSAMSALKTRAFWFICIAMLFSQASISAVQVHIAPYLENVGFAAVIAATWVMAVNLCVPIGRLGFGFAGDFTNKKYLMAAGIALQIIGLLIFSFINADRIWLIVLFILTFAIGCGGPIILRVALQADYFGTRSYGAIFGLMSTVISLGGLASPYITGWIFDVTGSYSQAWQLIALVSIPAIPLILLAKRPEGSNPAAKEHGN